MSSLDQYDPIFQAAGTEWNIDPTILKAIATQESGGDPRAVSRAGAAGLMGIIPSTQKYLGVTDPTDPVQSIYGGAKYLAEALTNEAENPAAALLYYHGGPGWRGAYGPESQGYVPAVAAHYAQYAQANTGTMTDATPNYNNAAAPAAPASPNYNNPPAAAAPQGSGGTSATATSAAPADPYTAAQTGANKPPAAAADADDPYTKAMGPKKASPEDVPVTFDEYGRPIPETQSPITGNLPSPEELRDRLQKGDINLLKQMAPGPDTNTAESVMREIGMLGVHAGAKLAQWPLDAIIALKQGPSGGATWNPQTGTFGVTPEALSTAGVAALPLRFSGPNPLSFVAPSALDQRLRAPIPKDVAPNLLSPDAAGKIGQAQGAPVTTVAPATVPTPFNTAPRAAPGEAPGGAPPGPSPGMGAPAGAAAAPPGGAPAPAGPLVSRTGVPVKPLPVPVAPAAPAMDAATGAWLKALPGQVQDLLDENAAVGGPSSLSAAATPPSSATMTPAQARSYRTMAELNEILSPIEGPDYNVYTPGVPHTLAEHEGDAVMSQKERVLRERDPTKFDSVTQPANKQLVNTFNDAAGTSVGAQTLREQMQRVDETNHTAVMAASAGKSADLEHIASQLDEFLNDPLNNKRDAVRKVLVPLREAMNDANGELETNPRAVWGMWSNVKDKLDVAKTAENSAEHAVQRQLLGLKKGLGDELNRVSNGKFDQLNQQHAELAKQLNAWEILQKKQGTLTNRTTGMINGDSFHRWLIDLAQRRGRPGIDPAMDLPDSTMRTLINMDNDLKLNSRIDLGKSRGSHTNMMFEVARAMGLAGVHGLTAWAAGGPGIGNMAVQQGLGILGSHIGNIRLNQLVRRQLPPPGGWPNLLQPPPY